MTKLKLSKTGLILSFILFAIIIISYLVYSKNTIKSGILNQIIVQPQSEANKNTPKYGHAEDFSWVSGKLEYYSLEGGCWTLHFEENKPTQTEKYNGVFALKTTESLKTQLKNNTFIVVKGKIIGQKFSMNCPPNIYEVTSIDSN